MPRTPGFPQAAIQYIFFGTSEAWAAFTVFKFEHWIWFMVLLFLLALLLAWPTMGLSLLAYVGLIAFQGYMKANARMQYADTSQAEREIQSGTKRVPSWAGNRLESEVFVETIQEYALRKGVPKTFVLAIITHKPTFESFVHLAGAMEHNGSSFISQQLAVSDKITEMWSDAPANVKVDALRG